MKLVKVSIERPITVIVFVIIILMVGIISFIKLPLGFLPEVTDPRLTIVTDCGNLTAEVVEREVSTPISMQAMTIKNIESISCYSYKGISKVELTFKWGTDVNYITIDLREKLENLSDNLPLDVSKPVINTYNPNNTPIMRLSISPRDNQKHSKTIEGFKDRLALLDGVAIVESIGLSEYYLSINIKRDLIGVLGFTISDIKRSIANIDYVQNCGLIQKGTKEYSLKIESSIDNWQQLLEIPVTNRSNITTKLGNLVEINESAIIDGWVRHNNRESIGLVVYKDGDANVVDVCKELREELENIGNEYPNFEIVTTQDQSIFIKESILSLLQSLVLGGLLAFSVLFIFLRDIKVLFVIGLVIPLAAISVFIPMYFSNLTLNIISLSGLAMGIGMLVDNAIVVTESIYRKKTTESLGWKKSAYEGTTEITSAIIASTITTIVVFIPLVFSKGIVSLLFKEEALTVCFSLVTSLFLSITLIPMLLSLRKDSKLIRLSNSWENSNIYKFLERVLDFVLAHRLSLIICYVLILSLSLYMLSIRPREYFPEISNSAINVKIQIPLDMKSSEAMQQVKLIESDLVNFDGISSVYTEIKEKNNLSTRVIFDANSDVAIVRLDMDGSIVEDKIIRDLQKYFKSYPMRIEIGKDSDFLTKLVNRGEKGVTIEISGNNSAQSRYYTEKLSALLKSEKYQVIDDINNTISVIEFMPDLWKLHEYNLSLSEINEQLSLAYNRVNFIDKEINNQKISYKYSGNKKNIEFYNLRKGDKLIPLREVGSLRIVEREEKLTLINHKRCWKINVLFEGAISDVNEKIVKIIESNPLPEGVTIKIQGQNRLFRQSMQSLLSIFLLSIVLVYLVMSAQFESFILPIYIMLSVPLALFGVVIALIVSGSSLNVMSFMGIICLVGIVVNNAILLVDTANIRMRKGVSAKQAAKSAALIRFRPILMTAMTTVFGLIPLCLSVGKSLQSSLAISMVGGLSVSTIFTLLFIPVFISFKRDKRESDI